MRNNRLPSLPVYPFVATMSVPGVPLSVTLQASSRPPSNSACHAASSSVFVPATFSTSVARLNAAPAPSVAELASPANAGTTPLPPAGGVDGAGVELPQARDADSQ